MIILLIDFYAELYKYHVEILYLFIDKVGPLSYLEFYWLCKHIVILWLCFGYFKILL